MKKLSQLILVAGLFSLNINPGCVDVSNDSNLENVEDSTPPTVSDSHIGFPEMYPTGFKLQWTYATDDVTGQDNLSYKVVRSYQDNISSADDADTNGTIVMAWTKNIISHTVDNLQDSTTYFFNVFVKDEAGNISAYSTGSESTPVPVDTIAPYIESDVISVSNITQSGMTLSWTAANDNVTPAEDLTYAVYMSGADNVNTLPESELHGNCILNWTNDLVWNSSTASLFVTELSPLTTCYFNVFVKDGEGNSADYTAIYASTQPDSTNPVPGSGVAAVVDGAVINLSWSAAVDDTNLQYQLLKSGSPISTLDDADTAEVIMEFTSYDDIDMPVVDGGLSPGTFHYNVVVRDEGGNSALYDGASATVVVVAYTVSGFINLPAHLAVGHYYVKLTDPVTFESFTSEAAWPSSSISPYEVYNVSSGNYFADITITGNSGEIIYEYKSTFPELAVSGADAVFIINAYPCQVISSDIYELNNDKNISTSNYISAGESQNHTFHTAGDEDFIAINFTSGQNIIINTSLLTAFTDTVLFLYNFEGSEIAVNDNSSGLYSQISYACDTSGTYYIRVIENGNDGTGDYIVKVLNADNVYSVSGKIILPTGDTLSGGYFYNIDIYIHDEYYSVFNKWPSGSSEVSFSVNNIPPGNYYTYAAVVDKNNTIHYEYESSAEEINITNADITDFIITADSAGSFYDVSGTISLPETDTLSNGCYVIELYDMNNDNSFSVSDFWPSDGHETSYFIENIPPENYSITVKVMDSGFIFTHEYDSGSEDLVVIDSDVTRNISVTAL